MATELVRNRSFIATTTLAARQYCFVKLNTSGGISLAGSGVSAIGVLQDKPAGGDPGAVCTPGDLTKIKCGNTVTAGEFLMSDANGTAVAATSGNFVLGQAREGGGAGDIITMLFQPLGESGFALSKL